MADRYDAGAMARAAGGIPVAGAIGPPSGIPVLNKRTDPVGAHEFAGAGGGRLPAAAAAFGGAEQ